MVKGNGTTLGLFPVDCVDQIKSQLMAQMKKKNNKIKYEIP